MRSRFPVLGPLFALGGLLGAAVMPAFSAETDLAGYVVYHRVQADLDGDGARETATAYRWPEYSLNHPPHLLVRKGDRVPLDLWLADTNVLIDGEGPPHGALQAADVTGDGRPELLFVPCSAGGSGGTQYPRVVYWNGKELANLRLKARSLNSINENGGAVFRPGPGGRSSLVLYDLAEELRGRRYRAQRFTFQGGQLVGGPVRTSRRSGKAGLQELGVR